MSRPSPWAGKAASLYDDAYARRYRAHDDELRDVTAYKEFVAWLRQTCERFGRPIDVLDLGCGTGRYFSALTSVRTLTGLDASAAMLAEARQPLDNERIAANSIELVEGDLLTHTFAPGRFDLVYAIGVLAEHVPLTARLAERVAGWLKPGGRFALTSVHPDSASIPRTPARSIGGVAARLAPGRLRSSIRERLLAGGLYADEAFIRETLEQWFEIESLTRMESEAHLHCLCVARVRQREARG